MENRNIDIMCISETFLNSNKQLDIMKNFNIVRFDRNSAQSHKHHGGGVAIITKPNLETTLYELRCTETIQLTSKIEVVVSRIKWCKRKPVIVACIYRPPNYDQSQLKSDLQALKLIFEELASTKLHIILCGDFNLRKSSQLNQLEQILHRYNMKQLIKSNTRKDAILDLMITNVSDYINNVDVFEAHIADHKATVCEYMTLKKPRKTKTITYRGFKNMNFASLATDLITQDIKYDKSESIEHNAEILITNIVTLFEKYAPLKSKKIVISEKVTKISDETRRLMKMRDEAEYINRSDYNELRKKVKQSINRDVRDSVKQKIETNGVWATINSLTSNKKQVKIPFNAEEINQYFVNICKRKTSSGKYTPPKRHHRNSNHKFKLKKLSTIDILNAWNKMNNKNSTTEDANGISNVMINNIISLPAVNELITEIFNHMIEAGYVPQMLKIARIIPLPKKDKMQGCGDLRPISILPVLAKIFEKCAYAQLIKFVTDENILTKFQFGFRPKSSASHAELYIKSIIKDNQFKNEGTAIVMLDIQKAFDTVDRDILIQKLTSYNIIDNCIFSYIMNRQQYVFNDSKESTIVTTEAGLAQGGCLSGILFSLFMNDLPDVLIHSKIGIYADDTQLLKNISQSNVDNDKKLLVEDCEKIIQWMQDNHLSINLEKTEIIFIPAKPIVDLEVFTVNILNKEFSNSSQIKSLGLIKDYQLKWEPHITYQKSKCNKAIWKLKSLCMSIPSQFKKTVAEALVMSTLNYMITVWGDCERRFMKEMDKIYKKVKKLVSTNLTLDSPEIKWLSPAMQYKYTIAILAYQSLHQIGPEVFFNKVLLENIDMRETRNKRHFTINRNQCKDYLEYIFTNEWIKIPSEIQSLPTLKIFKHKLKEHFYNSEKCDKVTCDETIDIDACIDNVVRRFCTQ